MLSHKISAKLFILQFDSINFGMFYKLVLGGLCSKAKRCIFSCKPNPSFNIEYVSVVSHSVPVLIAKTCALCDEMNAVYA